MRRCSLIIYTKNHRGIWGRAAAIGTKPFLYSKASTEMVILKDLFQTVWLSKWNLHFDIPSLYYSYLLRRESTERSSPDISLSLCIIETNESFSNVNAVVIMNLSHWTRAGSL